MAENAHQQFEHMNNFVKQIGGILNDKKTHVAGTNATARNLLRKKNLPVVLHARDLGAHVVVSLKKMWQNGA